MSLPHVTYGNPPGHFQRSAADTERLVKRVLVRRSQNELLAKADAQAIREGRI